MPPVTTISSEETEVEADQPAFKIINADTLDNVGVVKGESIFKPFGNNNNKLKPNIMVFPTRRANGNLEEAKNKNFTKSNGYLPSHLRNQTTLKKNYSNSHGNLSTHNNSARKQKEPEQLPNNPGLDVNFTKTLDAKLRKLQKEEKIRNAVKIKTPTELLRKPFVTTVKKGEFLEPPPEYANLLGIRSEDKDENDKLYAYASRPRIVHNNRFSNRVSTAGSNSEVHRSKCEAAAIAAAMLVSGVAGFRDAANRAKRDINSNIRKGA